MNASEQIARYKQQFHLYQSFTNKMRELVEELCHDRGLNPMVEARAKTPESFEEKIQRDGKTYKDPLNELIDLCGVRLICRRLSDLEVVKSLIESEFEVLPEHSSDKRQALRFDQFGYLSIHYGVKLLPSRLSLPEYRRFSSLKAEIQVRTVLQHAWAMLSHAFDYKLSIAVEK